MGASIHPTRAGLRSRRRTFSYVLLQHRPRSISQRRAPVGALPAITAAREHGVSGADLLPQPGGFEGFGTLDVLIHTRDLALAQRIDLVEARIDLDPACPAPP